MGYWSKRKKRREETVKIRITERVTEIEADARELRESNSLADGFAGMLKRAFQSREPFYEDEKEDEDAGEE